MLGRYSDAHGERIGVVFDPRKVGIRDSHICFSRDFKRRKFFKFSNLIEDFIRKLRRATSAA
jgi:hypothetical protein